jgi:hypothetical protein
MAWYPDWVVALDDVAEGKPYATVTQRNAQDVIREIKKMQARIAELEGRPRGVQIGDGNTQTITF